MTHGSLFSGIGGFDLAAQWAGWDNVFQVEIDNWCQKILTKNFPNTKRYGDIKGFDGREWRGKVDVISGGFPCQPYSTSGKRLGKADERHLWPQMLRVIREIAPTWVVGENVRGIVSWSEGLVFEEVCADLEASGYEVQPFILPAASVGAPHIRQRVWFIAHAKSVHDRGNSGELSAPECGQKRNNVSKFGGSGQIHIANAEQSGPQRQNGIQKPTKPSERHREVIADPYKLNGNLSGFYSGWISQFEATGIWEHFTNANGQRCQELNLSRFACESGQHPRYNPAQWDEWTTESPVCGMDDGVSRRLDRIAGLGNAVVPHVVFQIFDAINQYEANQ